MSDNARESFGEKTKAAVVPDSQKSLTTRATETVEGKADSTASTAQPQSKKSTPQKIGDTLSNNSNENNQSLLDKTKDTLGLNK
ncbi:MAG: heat shock protein 9/12-domain-containing protein [Lentinula lateritia]|uniref:Heat shock protein 9/12-domain-containing protein n=1 Tax=Lentinula lateritia TaxID=40482 RepID=A0ABQ8VDL6_9AGAR|nr:MAG: heat shock protein 9/12-domain-containing protein [Lentinula lateritia]KAJ4489222.1 heat shock protein 9/12-domain-containing protein [Lentinula lateritia]